MTLSEEILHRLARLSMTSDACLAIDLVGRVIFFDNRAEELWGYTFAELEGQEMEILMRPEDRGDHTAKIFQFSQGHAFNRQMGSASLPFFAHTKDGNDIPVRIHIARLETFMVATILRDDGDGTKALSYAGMMELDMLRVMQRLEDFRDNFTAIFMRKNVGQTKRAVVMGYGAYDFSGGFVPYCDCEVTHFTAAIEGTYKSGSLEIAIYVDGEHVTSFEYEGPKETFVHMLNEPLLCRAGSAVTAKVLQKSFQPSASEFALTMFASKKFY